MIYLLLLLLLLLLPHLPMVEPYDQMSPNDTTVTTSTMRVDDWVLVDTLAYNKSGTIHSLSWRLGDNNNSSSSSSSSTLFAASVHSCQVWQQRVAGRHHDLMQRLPSNITSSSSLVRAVAVSPDGKWLALGNDEGIVQIWSLEESAISLLLSLKINSTISLGSGKIRSISWHVSSRWLGVAGLQLGFVILQYSEPHSWTRVEVAAEPPDFALPTNSYLHYLDWSPMALAFVVDRAVYELVPSSSMSSNSNTSSSSSSSNNNNHSNVFRENPVANPTVVYRAVAALEACRLCTLSQWSPDGQFIATAFGSEITISQLRPDTTNGTASLDHWELVQNITTVQDTYMIITAMEWSPNGHYLAAGGAGNDYLFLYDTTSWQMVQIPTAYSIDALAWRPDSQQIAIGTGRMIEIHEFRSHPHDDSYPSITLVPSSYPTYSPSDYSMYVSPSSPPTIPSSDGIMSMAGMAGIGIAAVVLSLSCVALVFLQRWKFLQRRRRRSKDDDSKMGAHAEPTMSEDDYDSPMDRVITFTRNPNSSDNVVVE